MTVSTKCKKAAPVASVVNTFNDELIVRAENGEIDKQIIAKVALSPLYTAALTAKRFSTTTVSEVGITETVSVAMKMVDRVKAGDMSQVESMLVAQSIALNCIFTEMAARAANHLGHDISRTDTYLRMALKAQSQCRTTLETLSEVKNPRSTTFVRQQNNAHQQQVNNGIEQPSRHVRTHGDEKANRSNELLTELPHETLDARGTETAVRSDPQMETVGSINGPNDRQGKSC